MTLRERLSEAILSDRARALQIAVWAVVIVADLLIIWGTPWLPLGDLGGHVELMDIFSRYVSDETVYRDVYTVPTFPTANSLELYFAWLISPVAGTYAAAKLLLTWYLIGLPLSVLLVCRVFRRTGWMALFAATIALSAIWDVGFVNYLVALPFFVLSIGLSGLLARRWSWKIAALLAFTSAGAFFSHIFVYALTGAACALVFLLHLPKIRDIWRALPLLAPMPSFLHWAYEKLVLAQKTEAGRAFVSEHGELGAVYKPLGELFEQWHTWGMRMFVDNTDEAACLALLVAWFVLMLRSDKPAAAGEDGDEPGWRRALGAYTVELLALGALAAYFAFPSHLHDAQLIAERVIILVILFVAVIPRPRIDGPAARAAVAVVCAVAVLYPVNVFFKYEQFTATYVSGLPEAIGALEDQSRLAYVMKEKANEITHQGALWHLPKAMHTTLNGGITDDSFAKHSHHAVQYREGKKPPKVSRYFLHDPALQTYDYLLVRSDDPLRRAQRSDRLELLFQRGVWWLFEVHRPGVRTKSVGGGGGEEFFDICSESRRVVGLSVQTRGGDVANIRPMCGEPGESGGIRLGQRAGRYYRDARSSRLRCEDGEAVVGLGGTFGVVVTSLELICTAEEGEEAPQPGEASADAKDGEEQAGNKGRRFRVECPPGKQAVGIFGRAGLLVDSVGLICR